MDQCCERSVCRCLSVVAKRGQNVHRDWHEFRILQGFNEQSL